MTQYDIEEKARLSIYAKMVAEADSAGAQINTDETYDKAAKLAKEYARNHYEHVEKPHFLKMLVVILIAALSLVAYLYFIMPALKSIGII